MWDLPVGVKSAQTDAKDHVENGDVRLTSLAAAVRASQSEAGY